MRHDYRCPTCGWWLKDQERSLAEGGINTAPDCFHCDQKMVWTPTKFRTDLRTDGEGKSGETFQKFLVRDGLNNLVEVDSLSKLRTIERESEKMAADGIGQVVRFRAFEQDHSNMSVNVFGERPKEVDADMTLTKEGKQKFGLRNAAQVIDATKLESEPDYSYGPGVTDANTSALEDR